LRNNPNRYLSFSGAATAANWAGNRRALGPTTATPTPLVPTSSRRSST